MKSAILLSLVLGCAGLRFALAQGQQKPPQFGPPTGTYAEEAPKGSPSPALGQWKPPFILRLETNGTYVAEAAMPRYVQGIDGDRLFSYPDIVKGTWKWDAEKREFLLEPRDFTFFIKRLPIDPTNTNRLVWGSGFLERQKPE
jgi:hypothetical protein